MGFKHAEKMATQFRSEMDAAREDRDWIKAAAAKSAKDNWQKQADHERSMFTKVNWAVKHAEEKITYHSKRQEFNKCSYYQGVLDKASAYYEHIPSEDKVNEPETIEVDDVADDVTSPHDETGVVEENSSPPSDGVEVTEEVENEFTTDGEEEAAVDDDGLVGAAKSKSARKRKDRQYKYKSKKNSESSK
jgi:hypothetical protein